MKKAILVVVTALASLLGQQSTANAQSVDSTRVDTVVTKVDSSLYRMTSYRKFLFGVPTQQIWIFEKKNGVPNPSEKEQQKTRSKWNSPRKDTKLFMSTSNTKDLKVLIFLPPGCTCFQQRDWNESLLI